MSYVLELSYVSPSREKLEALRQLLGVAFPALQMLIRNTDHLHIDAEEEVGEIEQVRREALALPPTYRRGWDDRSDVGIGHDGQPTHIWRSPNPEDRFED